MGKGVNNIETFDKRLGYFFSVLYLAIRMLKNLWRSASGVLSRLLSYFVCGFFVWFYMGSLTHDQLSIQNRVRNFLFLLAVFIVL